jgi:hypothetical protein
MLQVSPFARQGRLAADLRAADTRRADTRRAVRDQAADEADGFQIAGSHASGAKGAALHPIARLLTLLPHAR